MNEYSPIEAKAHTAPYKIHRYFARRPWNVFRQLIELYSNKGDIILDPFCGGGVTIYEGLVTDRKVVGYDLNPLSVFIVKNMIKKASNQKSVFIAYKKIIKYLEYLYIDYDKMPLKSQQTTLFNKSVKVEWNELTFIVKCNKCGESTLLSNENKIRNGYYSCTNIKCKGNKAVGGYIEPKNCERIGYEYLFSVGYSPLDKKKVIVKFDDKRKSKIKEHILFLKKKLGELGLRTPRDEIPLDWDRQWEDLLFNKNIKTFQELFTERNLLINLLLLDYIKKLNLDKDCYETMRLIFSSSLRDTNIMAFTHQGWQSGKPTTWSKHAYWIPSQFCEVNVITAFKKAFNRMKQSLMFNQHSDYQVEYVDTITELEKKGNILLQTGSIAGSKVPSNSVDAIITDPPYGSNVQYLELSHFWYVWNKDIYQDGNLDFSQEAVANRKKNFKGYKDMKDYEDNLYTVFNKCYDVLKNDRYLVLTFNNKDISAWLALLISIFKAGFTLEENGLFFQSGVKNYKQTAHTKYKGSPYGDFIYVFTKKPIKEAKKSDLKDAMNFINYLDFEFKSFIHNFNKAKKDRNEVLRLMFLKTIPKIEAFIRLNNNIIDSRKLYRHFDKDYLKKMYH
ncbi:MAG: hypothetical protein A2046_03995 [Bacteroidetes bacterium GWA2_30_7]|nr:MAG: hypothetical protein A2046_03995 [Bacteroidetes bacterium GWA2_30_7]